MLTQEEKRINFIQSVNPTFSTIYTSEFFTEPQLTAEGFLTVDTILGRRGVLPYTYVLPSGETVVRNEFLSESIIGDTFKDSTEGAPFVLEHPQNNKGEFVDVDPTNYSKFIKGTITKPRRIIHNGERILVGTLKIFDPEVIQLILDKKLNQVSQGYFCRTIEEPGVFNGIPYEAKQVDMVMNHLALVNEGRAGDSVRILFNARTHKEVLEFVKNSKEKGEKNMVPNTQNINPGTPSSDSGLNSPSNPGTQNNNPGITVNQGGMAPDKNPMMQTNMPEGGGMGGMNPMMQMLQMLMQMFGGGGMMQGNAGGMPPFVNPMMQGNAGGMGKFQPFPGMGFNSADAIVPQLPSQTTTNNQATLNHAEGIDKVKEMIAGNIRTSQDAIVRAQSVLGNGAAEHFIKFNSVDEFKKDVLKRTKIKEDAIVDKMNSSDIAAYFDVATENYKSRINTPSQVASELAAEESEVEFV